MLTIVGKPYRSFCDGMTRRNFLRIGGLAMGGLALPQILRAQEANGVRNSHKAVIMIYLPGGPPHQDMWEIKTEAPSEIRGEFKPIPTNVPGIQICELFPRLASMMDKLVVIRTIVGCVDRHESHMCLSGYPSVGGNQPPGGRPCVGSVLAKLFGPVDRSVPPFVGLAPSMGHMPWANPGEPGFLGPAYAPFRPQGPGMADMRLNGITLERLSDRKRLLQALDRFRRECDADGSIEGMDAYTRQAFDVLTSSKLVRALDVELEDPKVRDRYGRGSARKMADGSHRLLDQFLVARRLVEAGVRCVTLAFSRWDWHGGNFRRAREDMPMLDQGVSALVEDLDSRGMLDDVTVVVWGEFGRTPRINKTAGRDHWPAVSCCLLAGGGMRTGQAIGRTNRLGEVPQERPVHVHEVFSTIYWNLGIDVRTTTIPDQAGRPQYLVDIRKPIEELV